VALWFPRLPTDRLQRRGKLRPAETAQEAPPLVVVAKLDNALRLSAVDRKATSLVARPAACHARAMLLH
jgi:protein ImuB